MALRKHVLTQPKISGQGGRANWSKWLAVEQSPGLFTAVCCDCALTHQHEYRIKTLKNGRVVLLMRVRRANGYTQAGRKRRRGIERLNKGEKIRALINGVWVAVLPNDLQRGSKGHGNT